MAAPISGQGMVLLTRTSPRSRIDITAKVATAIREIWLVGFRSSSSSAVVNKGVYIIRSNPNHYSLDPPSVSCEARVSTYIYNVLLTAISSV